MSTFMTLLGLVALSFPCVMLALAGLFQMMFNNMGGNGTRWSTMAGLLMLLIGGYLTYSIWANYSPVYVVVIQQQEG